MIAVTPPSNQPGERPRIRGPRFKSQATQKEKGFYQNRPNVIAFVGGCPDPRELTEALCLPFVHLKPSFAANFISKGKKKKMKKKKKKKKKNKTT